MIGHSIPIVAIEELPYRWVKNEYFSYDQEDDDCDLWGTRPEDLWEMIFDLWLRINHPATQRVGNFILAPHGYERPCPNLYQEYLSDVTGSWADITVPKDKQTGE